MADYFDKPQHWRMRAEMNRTIAAGMMNLNIRKLLLSTADQYDKMAQQLEGESIKQPVPRVIKREISPARVDDMTERLRELQRKFQRVGK